MKIPYFVRCSECKSERYVFQHVNEDSLKFKCECGFDNSGPMYDFSIGFKIILKSIYEFETLKDYSMSIVYSATAVDCELTRLNKKWRTIHALSSVFAVTENDLNSVLLQYRSIFNKIKKTATLMYPDGFINFVIDIKKLKEKIINDFPSLKLNTLINNIHENLFVPRNNILHSSEIVYSDKEATKAINIARLTLLILQELDEYKRNNN